MKDIELAKKILKEENNTLVAVNKGEVIYKSKEKGIKPMYNLTKSMKEEAKGASIADKVIGRGAALLSIFLGVKEVYGELISKGAIEILNSNKIGYEFDNICDYIKNRDKSGLCPIENLSLDVREPEELIAKIEEFFKGK